MDSCITGTVTAVSTSASHTMQKFNCPCIRLLAGLGVEGDIHAGTTVTHQSRLAAAASEQPPNLRQVHLVHSELHQQLLQQGFEVGPGRMGENITTWGIDLLALPRGTQLHLGAEAVVEVTGLRNPCAQLNGIQAGLMAAVLSRDEEGRLVRKAGIMGVVLKSGIVLPGDQITAELPPQPWQQLECV